MRLKCPPHLLTWDGLATGCILEQSDHTVGVAVFVNNVREKGTGGERERERGKREILRN
jgi:hypothetical protein